MATDFLLVKDFNKITALLLEARIFESLPLEGKVDRVSETDEVSRSFHEHIIAPSQPPMFAQPRRGDLRSPALKNHIV